MSVRDRDREKNEAAVADDCTVTHTLNDPHGCRENRPPGEHERRAGEREKAESGGTCRVEDLERDGVGCRALHSLRSDRHIAATEHDDSYGNAAPPSDGA